jgi:RNA polymerase sigma-70 factor (ECF subfamily)
MDERLSSMESTRRLLSPDDAEAGLEAAWVNASQRGDNVAFNRLVLKWEKSIYNLALRMLQNPDEAAEAAQEVFLSAFVSIRRFRSDSRFSTWLYRIAVNHCISRLRKRPPGIHYSLEDREAEAPIEKRMPSSESHEKDFFRAESRGRVRQALVYLSDEQRAIVELKFFQELTFEEIASIIRIPLSTVKSRLYSGLEILKVRLAGVAPTA